MKKTQIKNLLSFVLCMVLIAAMALFAVGCNDKDNQGKKKTDTTKYDVKEDEVLSIGEGDTEFDFTVVDKNGKETKFKVATDKEFVGEALLDVKLIEGEVEQYGLYVKKVNGIALDFNKDGMYWAFYINEEYSTTGVDSIKIVPGKYYMFKATK